MIFCPLPYMHRIIYPDGEISQCCMSRKRFHMGFDQFDNSSELQDIKSALGRGMFPDACAGCRDLEESGHKSLRQEALEEYTDFSQVTYLDVRFSNKCNLSCRMCSPEFSSRIAKEEKVDTPYTHIDEKVVNDIKNSLKNVTKLMFTGGEPMIIDEIKEICEYAVSEGYSKDIHLVFTTNGTKIDDEWAEISRQFKDVHWTFSVDGVGELNDYIRYGSSWEIVDRNIRKIMKEGWSVGINTVVSSYNIMYLGDLFNYGEELSGEYDSPFDHWFHICQTPDYLSPYVYNDNDKIKETLRKLEDRNPIVKTLIANLGSVNRFKQFRSFTETKDKIRGQTSEGFFWYGLD